MQNREIWARGFQPVGRCNADRWPLALSHSQHAVIAGLTILTFEILCIFGLLLKALGYVLRVGLGVAAHQRSPETEHIAEVTLGLLRTCTREGERAEGYGSLVTA